MIEDGNPGYSETQKHWIPVFEGVFVITKSAGKAVITVEAGIQNLLKILDSVSRFACTE